MAGSMLEAILEDVSRPDSAILGDMARAMLAGASPGEATAAGRASLAFAAVREVVPIVRRLRDEGFDPATIRRVVRCAVAIQPASTEGFLDAVAERALESVLGPEPAGGSATA